VSSTSVRTTLWRWVGLVVVAALLLALGGASVTRAQDTTAVPAHGASMYGDLKYPADFTNLEYADPDAPKGGEITLAATGTFNSFNPYILEGDAFYTSFGGGSRFIETLTEQAADEAFSEYCLLCETITMPEDRSYVEFKLRDIARWSDGTPVTADDLIFSYDSIVLHGHPFYQDYWGSIVEATKVDDLTVRFDFDPAEAQNRELPLIAGQLPVFQQAWWEGREFDVPSLDVPVSSGPYLIEDVKPGSSFAFVRNPDYWGNDIPLNKGRFNFDRINIDYYRDLTVALEAFKAGEFDFRYENSSKSWATGYDFPALTQGLVTKEMIPNSGVNGMQGFVFNQRRDIFTDPQVREALTYALDFEWSNKNLFYDQYSRSTSYWANSELAAPPGPPTGEELAYLEPWRDQLDPRVFTDTYAPPSTGGTEEGLRANIAKAIDILAEAGWTINDESKLVNEAGEPFAFEIVLDSQSWERITQPFIDNLKRMGIEATMRLVDPSQFETLTEDFDYDMIVHNRGMSPSPGNEQKNYWTCEAAETRGSQNYWGVCSEALDALVDNVVQADSRENLVQATRALDRALLWDFLVVPHWYIGSDRVAYWNVIGRPAKSADYGLDFNTWYYKPDVADAVRQAQEAAEFVDTAATEEAAATLGITPPTPLPQPTMAPVEAITTTEVVTETTAGGEGGQGGGFPGGPVGIGIAVIVAAAVLFWLARSRGQS